MFLGNKAALVNSLYHMCKDCKDKETDCLVIKLGECPFKRIECNDVTISLWEHTVNEKLKYNPADPALTNRIASLYTSIYS